MLNQVEQAITRKIESGEGSQTPWLLRWLVGGGYSFNISGVEVENWSRAIEQTGAFTPHPPFPFECYAFGNLSQNKRGHKFILSVYQRSAMDLKFFYNLKLPSGFFEYQEFTPLIALSPTKGTASDQQLRATLALIENLKSRRPASAH